MATATAFLYTGANPVQTGVADGTISAARVAVLRGRVLATDGRPLPSVTITVQDHPEFGQTISRADGEYDLAINAGTPVVLDYTRAGFLPVQRHVDPPVRDYEMVPDVVVESFDPNVATIDSAATAPQAARGSTMSDASGSRRATLLFMPGTHATLHLPDGSTQSPASYHVRATEFTVGDLGPEAMPGDLPASSGYTYAADYSLDEAVDAHATAVTFDKPVISYTDNFLGFPVGSPVPVGSYDQTKSAWIPEANGIVIKVLGSDAQGADLDVDGDGVADTGAKLDALGITSAERIALAGLYPAGTELWRTELAHFSDFDINWPFEPPPDATPPNAPAPKPPPPANPNDPHPRCRDDHGSQIECADRSLDEDVPVTGTPYSLHYSSGRAVARQSRTIEIQLTGATVPASLGHVELEIDVAGRRFNPPDFPAAPNQTYEFTWDGKDGYGRSVAGRQDGVATITYVYPADYKTPPASSTRRRSTDLAPVTSWSMSARGGFRVTERLPFSVGAPALPPAGLGGWTFDVHHAFDPNGQSVQLGDGDSLIAPVTDVSDLLLDRNTAVAYPAHLAVFGVAPQPDGAVWFADQETNADGSRTPIQIRRIASDGTVSDVATLPAPPAPVNLSTVLLASAPGGGAYALATWDSGSGNGPLFRIAPDGTVTQVTAGDPLAAQSPTPGDGDGLAASQVVLDNPEQMAAGPDGSVYILEQGSPYAHLIRIGARRKGQHVDRRQRGPRPAASRRGRSRRVGLCGHHPRILELMPSGELRPVVGGEDSVGPTAASPARPPRMPTWTSGKPRSR